MNKNKTSGTRIALLLLAFIILSFLIFLQWVRQRNLQWNEYADDRARQQEKIREFQDKEEKPFTPQESEVENGPQD